MVADTVALPRRARAAGLRRLRALLRRLPARPRLRRRAAASARSRPARRVGVLCDTNGGMLPTDIHEIVAPTCWRAAACGWASTARTTPAARWPTALAAVEAGVTHVQCTANGYGERTGNADLFVVVANLELKLGMRPAARRASSPRPRGSRTRSPTSPTSRPTPIRPMSGSRPSRTRRACTRRRSRSTTSSTTTSDPELVGNDSGCWSPRWPAGRRSS